MAVTAEKSTQANVSVTGLPLPSTENKGTPVMFKVDFTQGAAAGDANSTQDLIILPPGRWRYWQHLSKLFNSAFGAARLLDIGHTGYTEPDGDVIAADVDAIDSLHDVAAAGSYQPGDELLVDGSLLINSKTPVTIQARVTGGTIPAAATVKGVLVFQKG